MNRVITNYHLAGISNIKNQLIKMNNNLNNLNNINNFSHTIKRIKNTHNRISKKTIPISRKKYTRSMINIPYYEGQLFKNNLNQLQYNNKLHRKNVMTNYLAFLENTDSFLTKEYKNLQENKGNVIEYYLVDETDEYAHQNIKEIVDYYIKLYGLEKFNARKLPEYLEDLYKKSETIYHSSISESSNLENLEDLQKLLDKRLEDLEKCKAKYSDTSYYKDELELESKDITKSVEDRCRNIKWNENQLYNLQQTKLKEDLDKLIELLGGDISILKTFVDPNMYIDKSDEDFYKSLLYYIQGNTDSKYKQFVFGYSIDVSKIFNKIFFNFPKFFKRAMQKNKLGNVCSPLVEWSLLLNNIVTRCMSIDTLPLFPIMYILPNNVFVGLNKGFNFRISKPLSKNKIFNSSNYKYVGMISIKYNYITYNENEKRLWLLFVFQKKELIRKTLPDPFLGNYSEFILLNIYGQYVSIGDLFGKTSISYLELNQLTQKYKLNCFYKQISNEFKKDISLLFMTPYKNSQLTEQHKKIIKQLGLINVNISKQKKTDNFIISHINNNNNDV